MPISNAMPQIARPRSRKRAFPQKPTADGLACLRFSLAQLPGAPGLPACDAGVQRAVNLAVLGGGDAVAKAIEPPGQLGPEGEALTQRKDRPERGDMFAADLSVDTTGLHQARLKAAALMSEADKHRSGI
jgi:hypothetical protein